MAIPNVTFRPSLKLAAERWMCNNRRLWEGNRANVNDSNPNGMTQDLLGIPGSDNEDGPPERVGRDRTAKVLRNKLNRPRFNATFWLCIMPSAVALGACLLEWDGVPLSWSIKLHPIKLFFLTLFFMMLVGPIVYAIHHGIDHASVWRAVRRCRYALRTVFLVVTVVALDLSLIRWFGWDYSPEAKLVLFLAGIFYAAAIVGFIHMMVEDFVPRSKRRT